MIYFFTSRALLQLLDSGTVEGLEELPTPSPLSLSLEQSKLDRLLERSECNSVQHMLFVCLSEL